MKQKFYSGTIQGSFIKNILSNTPLPICNTVAIGDYILEGKIYIYKNNIIKCTRSGYLGVSGDSVTADYKRIEEYYFGEKIVKFTDKGYTSLYDFYDLDTHKRLGKYLRCFRDYYDIDLMPFYNCFAGDYEEGIRFKDDTLYTLLKTSSYKTFKVPIRLNKTYTIAIDSMEEVYIAPVFMRNYDLLYVEDASGVEKDLTATVLDNNKRLKRYNSMSFKKPVTYEVNIIGETYQELLDKYEDNLCLLIQVSSLNESSLVVLEGDYTNLDCKNVFDVNNINNISDIELNKLLISNLSLLQFSDGTNYPFANRLVEYLLLNVIHNNDEISSNIKRVQDYVGFDTTNNYYPGIFTNEMRKFLFDYAIGVKTTRKLDINGFVDKEVERLVLKGKN